MNKHLLILASLLPVAAFCEPTPVAPTAPEAPGLSFRAPAPEVTAPKAPPILQLVPPGESQRYLRVVPPNGGALELKPGLRLAPLGKAPGSGTPLKIVPPAVPAPEPQRTDARQLVFREEDRAATKVFHPLLTHEVYGTVYPATPNK